jgi:hypothetical protein
MGSAAVCSKCGTPYTPDAKGWMARVEGPVTSGRADTPLREVLLCPADFGKLSPRARMAWHEHTGHTQGPTREKRPGRLGEAD